MKILVTGSQGGIGRWMVKALLEAGHTIRTLDRGAQARENSWEHLPGDVRDLPLVRRAAEGVDAVIHMAAIMTDVPGLEDFMFSVNIQGTWNILMACREAGVPRLVNFSSLQALGHSSPYHTALYVPLDDSVPKQPASTYQISKHVVEEMCQAYTCQNGLVIVSLRPTYVYQPVPDENRWWQNLPEEVLARSATSDYWSFVDVRDVCQAALLSLTASLTGHHAFLLASDYTLAKIPTLELAKKYYSRLPWLKVKPEDYVKDNPYRSLIDCSRAKEVLGWQPTYSQRQEILGEAWLK